MNKKHLEHNKLIHNFVRLLDLSFCYLLSIKDVHCDRSEIKGISNVGKNYHKLFISIIDLRRFTFEKSSFQQINQFDNTIFVLKSKEPDLKDLKPI